MYLPRYYVTTSWYDTCPAQHLNCSQEYYKTGFVADTKYAIKDGFESFVKKLGCFRIKARDAVASLYCTVDNNKENFIDGFEDLVGKINNRTVNSGKNWHLKDDLVDNFECFVDKSKKISLLVKNRVNLEHLKDQAIDNFEELVEKSKMLGLQTTDKLRKVNCVKETLKDQAIENFESFVEKSRGISMEAQRQVKKVKSFKETVVNDAVDNFENLMDKSKNVGFKTCNVKCYAGEKKDDVIDEFEEFVQKITINANNKVQKVENIKEQVIDEFEDLVARLRTNVMDLECNVKSFTKEKREDLVDELEELIEKMRNFGTNIVEKTNDKVEKVHCVKEEIIDSFENLLTKLNDFGVRTDNEVRQKINCMKEEVVDEFEDLVERFNTKLKCVENNMKGYTDENKAFIIDQFEDIIDDLKNEINFLDRNLREKVDEFFDDFQDIFEDTRCMLECKTTQIIENAECVFEEFVEQMEDAFVCGKNDVERELCAIKYWLCMGDMLVKDFLCYSERMVEEFCRFSEKRLACLLCGGKQKAKVFYNEVIDSLVRGFEDKLLCDNLVLEINSSRYAYNVTMSEVNFHVVRALLTLPGPDGRSWKHIVSRLSYFMPILTNYIRTDAAQKDCLLAIEDVAGSNPEIFAFLVKIIHWLYEHDVLSEDVILNWYNKPSPDADPNNSRSVRQQVAPFIRWLQEAEEDDDDDDNDD